MKLGNALKMGLATTIEIEDSIEYTIAGVQSYGKGVVNRRSEFGKSLKMKKYQVIEPGFLMWCKVDTKNGAFGITKEEHRGSLASTNMALAKIDTEKFNPYFLERLFTFDFFHGYITHLSSGSTNRKYLTPKQLFELVQIPELTKKKQDDFIELVDSIEKIGLSTELNHQLDLVTQLRQAFLREAMQGKLVEQNETDEPATELLAKIKAEKEKLIKDPPAGRAGKKIKKQKPLPPISEDEIPYKIPKSWVWCRLGASANQIFDGPFGSHLKTADYTNSGVQVIRLENLGVMKFNHSKETFVSFKKYESIKSHEVFEGDIIIGSFLADGVRCLVLPKLEYQAIAKADCFTIRLNRNLFHEKFLMYLLNSSCMYSVLFSLLRGMTRLRINTTQLKSLPIPLPPLFEQQRIVAKLDKLMAYCDSLEESIKNSQTQNEMLLGQVLREALEPEEKEVVA